MFLRDFHQSWYDINTFNSSVNYFITNGKLRTIENIKTMTHHHRGLVVAKINMHVCPHLHINTHKTSADIERPKLEKYLKCNVIFDRWQH